MVILCYDLRYIFNSMLFYTLVLSFVTGNIFLKMRCLRSTTWEIYLELNEEALNWWTKL